MSIITRMKLEPEYSPSDSIQIKIPKKGDIPPSDVQTTFSGVPPAREIRSIVTTNYIPGKITFEKSEES